MAKSFQSKWKSAEKRKKNVPRELYKFKSILKVDGDALMKDTKEITTVVVHKYCQEEMLYDTDDEKDNMKMETEIERNKKTLLGQHGQYLVWMNQRQRKKLKAKRDKKWGKVK
ncbi:protein LLP homolog [Rattus rattus]|uniref:protein LLP homolog n=1 Tax=Rattus rattus TaxID=10117 RepID=UPI0013F381CC|nr:protein LLP homolog [Rattus rattus]